MEATPQAPKHVAIAEDNTADVLLVREALLEAGIDCSLEVFDDGLKLIERLKTLDANAESPIPDLLFVDLNLPRADGSAVLDYLKTSYRCQNVSVIVMTSADLTAGEKHTLDLGNASFFQKPTALDDFLKLGQLARKLLENGSETRT